MRQPGATPRVEDHPKEIRALKGRDSTTSGVTPFQGWEGWGDRFGPGALPRAIEPRPYGASRIATQSSVLFNVFGLVTSRRGPAAPVPVGPGPGPGTRPPGTASRSRR